MTDLERVARAICRGMGRDPDKLDGSASANTYGRARAEGSPAPVIAKPVSFPAWRRYEQAAREVLKEMGG